MRFLVCLKGRKSYASGTRTRDARGMRHLNLRIAFYGHLQRVLQPIICGSVNLNDVEFLIRVFGIVFWIATVLAWDYFLLED